MITHQSSLDNFHEQLTYVLSNYKPHGYTCAQFSNVFIGGMGGSGIGGRITKIFFSSSFPLPVEVMNDYHLPAYVNERSLVILSSYSGNTEETLSMLEEAKERGCTVIAITSGGQLLELAKHNAYTHYTLEPGFQPRMALGYSLGFMLMIFGELSGQQVEEDLKEAAETLEDNARHKQIAADMQKKFQSGLRNKYVIIADAAFEGVAIRLQQQLNENAKCEAFVNILPECNHNVIESYYGQLPTNFVLLNSNTNERVSARFDFVASLLEKDNNKVLTLQTQGIDIPTIFDIIHACDWYTVNITEPLQVNPMEIENIISLKDFLTEV